MPGPSASSCLLHCDTASIAYSCIAAWHERSRHSSSSGRSPELTIRWNGVTMDGTRRSGAGLSPIERLTASTSHTRHRNGSSKRKKKAILSHYRRPGAPQHRQAPPFYLQTKSRASSPRFIHGCVRTWSPRPCPCAASTPSIPQSSRDPQVALPTTPNAVTLVPRIQSRQAV